jgi:organic radical activating enzyme
MEIIQIELTSACVMRCSNCTRFCGTHKVPFFMEPQLFRKSIDSLVEYALQPHAIVGFMGGEPLLHPQFPEFCKFAASKIPRKHLGLWSTLPDIPKYKEYSRLICETFGVIFLNDHSRNDILHAPVLMASEDYFRKPCPACSAQANASAPSVPQPLCPQCQGRGTISDDAAIEKATEDCWVQNSWSASINPRGAWFCEVAAALADLFNGPQGWDIEPGWWKRVPADFKAQRDWACRKCGAALPLVRIRNSQDTRDDVSVTNLERLKEIKSRKVARGEYALREQFAFDSKLLNSTYPNQTYKDIVYRKRIAARYGIRLTLDQWGNWEPTMMPPGYRDPDLEAPAARRRVGLGDGNNRIVLNVLK